MISFYAKLIKNWECGLFTVVKDKDNNYTVFTFKDEDGKILNNYWGETKEEALNDLSGDSYYSIERTSFLAETKKWEIICTIHPSELMGKGCKVGDKVGVRGTNRTGVIIETDVSELPFLVRFDDSMTSKWFNPRDLEVKFKEPEEMVTLPNGKKVSMSTVVSAIEGLTK